MYVIIVLRSREPISYGEESIGIKTLIKRISILLPEQDEIIQVPVILGNGLRGVLRDIMTITFLERVAKKAKDKGIKDIKVDARVLLLMLTGGVLKRRGEGQITAKNIYNLQDRAKVLLPLNIMGFALSNIMIPSKIKVSMFYPICSETYTLVEDLVEYIKSHNKGNKNIDFDKLRSISIKNIIGEVQMMHKDDAGKLVNLSLPGITFTNIDDKVDSIRREQAEDVKRDRREQAQAEQTQAERVRLQAIFRREYVMPGTVFIGFISEIIPLSDAEKALLALSIKKLKENSGVGGAVVRGFGSFNIEYMVDVQNNLNLNSSTQKDRQSIIDIVDNFIEQNQNLNKILEVLNSNPEDWLGSPESVEDRSKTSQP